MPRNVLNTGLLCAGTGEAFIKKTSLGKSPLLETGGEGSFGIQKNITDFQFASQNIKPTLFYSVSTATWI